MDRPVSKTYLNWAKQLIKCQDLEFKDQILEMIELYADIKCDDTENYNIADILHHLSDTYPEFEFKI